jgi:hypothetical protein
MDDLVWIKKYENKYWLVCRKTKEVVGYIEVYPYNGINGDYDRGFCCCNITYGKSNKTFMSVDAGYHWLVSAANNLKVAEVPKELHFPRLPK